MAGNAMDYAYSTTFFRFFQHRENNRLKISGLDEKQWLLRRSAAATWDKEPF